MPVQPSLSVVVPTTHPGGTLGACAGKLIEQLQSCSGELILVDGSPRGDAVSTEIAASAVVIREPHADVFRLRQLGARAARGAVIAFTEDHCLPADDWCEAILAAHGEHPGIAAIAGPTCNGSPASLVDRANFLVTFAPMLPPLPAKLAVRTPPPNNLSIKAAPLAGYDLTPGLLELEIVPHLNRVGQLILDDRIVLKHIQSHGMRRTPLSHFHNGRSTTGLPRRRLPLGDRGKRTLDSVALVPRHMIETWREVSRRPGERRPALPAMPWVLALLVAHAAGQIAGLIAGPGNSPKALE